MDLGYFLYMSECAGSPFITERTAALNKSIEDFIAAAKTNIDINDYDFQFNILLNNDINMDTLSENEKKYIKERVDKYLL